MSDLKLNIQWSFIRSVEGFKSEGYVPQDRSTGVQSGVTIGAGFDIGQHSVEQLKAFHFTPLLFSKLEMFAGITGLHAFHLLSRQRLSLTDEELEELEVKVHEKYARQIEKEYNENSCFNFNELSAEQQTVIASVGFQYGSLKKRCPKFFKAVVEADWQRAIDILNDFKDDYAVRRKKEAKLLSTSIPYIS